MTTTTERTVGLIGCGLIGRQVLRAVSQGELPGWRLGSVLARTDREVDGVRVTADSDRFLAAEHDLVIDAAGPAALAALGPVILERADLWSVSGAALVDDELRARIVEVGRRSGHRLRLLPGAVSGLDGVAATTLHPEADLHVEVDLPPSGPSTVVVFEGSARQAAERYPHHVNVAIASGLAGPGLDRTRVTVRQPAAGERHTIRVTTTGRDGSVIATTHPVVDPTSSVHIVGAALVAALRVETGIIYVG